MRIGVQEAVKILKSGQVVALPTETVYGLAACLNHSEAIQSIFKIKGRPLTNPLIIHVCDPQDVVKYAETIPPQFAELAEKFWPGPLTLIVPVKSELVPAVVRANLSTAGFRMPDHLLTLEVLQATGPLVMPSANLSGRPSATRPEHVEEDFGFDFPVLDGGTSTKGLESTILYYQASRWGIVRLGAIPSEAFEEALGYIPDVVHNLDKNKPLCPGQLFRHYAPKAQLFFGEEMNQAPFVLGFAERSYPSSKRFISLGSIHNPKEVAENLYHVLRQLDQEGASSAWIDMDFPSTGLWQTISERLHRAAE